MSALLPDDQGYGFADTNILAMQPKMVELVKGYFS
jgi:hypothetical protein